MCDWAADPQPERNRRYLKRLFHVRILWRVSCRLFGAPNFGSVCNFTTPATLFPGGVLLEDNTMPELTAERVRELLDYM